MMMRLPLWLMFGVMAAGGAMAVAQDQLTVDAKLNQELVRLGGQLMLDGKAYAYDEHLADDIGPRLTGSANYEKAVAWAEDEFKRLGLKNVHGEEWVIPATWEPEGTATARMIAPHEQALHLVSEGWSPSTPPGGVRGEVVYLDDVSAEGVKAAATNVKDRIVLVDSDSMRKHPDQTVGKMFDAIDLLAGEGARALVLGIGATNNAPSMAGLTDFKGTEANIVTANLGMEDTLLLKRLLDKGPVEIEFSFKNRIRKNVTVNNVVAEIPGSEDNGEYVIVGGHLDSWNPGTGAQDNGTGAASVLAVAQAVRAAGLKPRRTMRFILFGGEEEGLIGSLRYAHAHAADAAKCGGDFVTDTGDEAPKGWYTFGRKDEADAVTALKPLLANLDAWSTTDVGRFTFSTDEGPFLVQGVPSFVLWTPLEKYMQLHHKPSDTFDKVDPRDLNLGATVVGVTAYAFANSPTTLKHYTAAEVEDELKQIKSLDEYKDMQAHDLF